MPVLALKPLATCRGRGNLFGRGLSSRAGFDPLTFWPVFQPLPTRLQVVEKQAVVNVKRVRVLPRMKGD